MLAFTGPSARADELPKPLKHRKAGALSKVLTGPNGMALYTFAKDKEPGESVCSGPCAENWPPFRGLKEEDSMKIARTLGARLALGAAVVTLAAGGAQADKDDHSHPPGTPAHEHPKAPVRITMEELHKHGGVPPGWRLTVPPGDPRGGREVFTKLECYKCHVIKGEQFPHAAKGPGDAGPDLTGMGSHHPAEYFLEAILNPNAVIVTAPGHTGPDGLSIMPDYRESLTVDGLIDLVAYMQSLKGEHGHPPAGGSGHAPPGHPHGGQPKGH